MTQLKSITYILEKSTSTLIHSIVHSFFLMGLMNVCKSIEIYMYYSNYDGMPYLFLLVCIFAKF
jgi:hypothetical protein